MDGLEVTVLLGVAVLVGAVLAPRIRMAVPLVLLILGLLLGFVPQFREVQLPPDTVLLLFLPVLLFWESLTTSLRAIRRDLRPIVLMSTLLVVATAFAIAWVATLFGMPWSAALVLGAAVAPPDATAASALGSVLPRRNFLLLKAESLTNDGTALVIYALAVSLALGGTITPLSVTWSVVVSYVGGIAAGVVLGLVSIAVMRRVTQTIPMNVALLITPFAAYMIAELVHASGVLAVVVAGLVISQLAPRASTAASRRQAESAWPLGVYVLNGALFVLIGLEAQAVAWQIGPSTILSLAAIATAVWLATLVVRFLFQTIAAFVVRALDRRPQQRGRRVSWRGRVVSTVSGFRGAISLAIALSVPVTVADGTGFPWRDEIIFITAGVVLLTVLVQGPLLPRVVSWAKLPDDSTERNREQSLVDRELTAVALRTLDDLADEQNTEPEVRERIRTTYTEQMEDFDTRKTSNLPDANSFERGETATTSVVPMTASRTDRRETAGTRTRPEQERQLRRAILQAKREALAGLRHNGTIDDALARETQTRLDVEEIRLTGAEPVE